MSAEPSAVTGSPATTIQWLDRPGRFVQIGYLKTALTPDESIILAELMFQYGRCVPDDHILNRLYLDQRREEPDNSGDSLKVKVCRLRKYGLRIARVWDTGYRLEGIVDPFAEVAGA